MSSHVVIPVLAAFAVSLVLGPIVIPFLRKLKMKQTERVEGVQSHLKKAGTPTMGGIIILAAVIVTSLFYVKDYPKIIPVLFLTVAFGLIGFLDDYLKVVLKRSDGLMPMQKMALQIIVTAVFAFYLVKVADIPLTMLVPFSNGYYLDGSSAFVCGSDRNSQRNKLYRWTGWPCFQCDRSCRNIFYSCGDRNEKRDRTCHLCCSRGAAWIFTV
jgi:UDP-N-acetylmuramyl pentapeptide phosphotransferase/UDP-N-acetylglucosamine-1-phosphate transferase